MYFLLVIVSCVANNLSALDKGSAEVQQLRDSLAKHKVEGKIPIRFKGFIESEEEDRRQAALLFLEEQFNFGSEPAHKSPGFLDKDSSGDNYLTLVAKMRAPNDEILKFKTRLMDCFLECWGRCDKSLLEKLELELKAAKSERRLPQLPINGVKAGNDAIGELIKARVNALYVFENVSKSAGSTLLVLLSNDAFCVAKRFLDLEADFREKLGSLGLLERYRKAFAVGVKGPVAKSILEQSLQLVFKFDGGNEESAAAAEDPKTAVELMVSPAFLAAVKDDKELVEAMISLDEDLLTKPVEGQDSNALMVAIAGGKDRVFGIICDKSGNSADSPLGKINWAKKDALIIAINSEERFVVDIVSRYFHRVANHDHLAYAIWAQQKERYEAARLMIAAGLNVPSKLKSYSKMAGLCVAELILGAIENFAPIAALGADLGLAMPGVATGVCEAASSSLKKLIRELNLEGYFKNAEDRERARVSLRDMQISYDWTGKIGVLLGRNPKCLKLKFLYDTFVNIYEEKFEILLKKVKKRKGRTGNGLDDRLIGFTGDKCGQQALHKKIIGKSLRAGLLAVDQISYCVCTVQELEDLKKHAEERAKGCASGRDKDENEKCYIMIRNLQTITTKLNTILDGGHEA